LRYYIFDPNSGMVTPRTLGPSTSFPLTVTDMPAVLQIGGGEVSTYRGP
jgi:hypothetical protein